MEWKERQQQQLASEYKPDAVMDAQLARGSEWVNTQLPPAQRMELGRYLAKREAYEQEQRTARAEAARAAKSKAAVE